MQVSLKEPSLVGGSRSRRQTDTASKNIIEIFCRKFNGFFELTIPNFT
jgi:hypothetical protein